jgi:hypothetical protein
MLAVLIRLTPGRRNGFIDCQKAKVHIAVIPSMNGKTCWNWTLGLLERACRLRELTQEWLQNPQYTDYPPIVTTQDEWTIVKYVIEVLKPFRYCTLRMSKMHRVTFYYAITLTNDKFDHMVEVIWALAEKKTQWKEDFFFAVKLAHQMLSKS